MTGPSTRPVTPEEHLDTAIAAHEAAVGTLRSLAGQQMRFVDEGRSGTLRRLVGHRAGVVEEVVRTDRAVRDLIDDDAHEHLRSRLADARRRLDEVRAIDDEVRRRLEDRRIEVSGELRRMAGSDRARRAYGDPGPAAPQARDDRA